jgi:hypothetical protein
MLRFPTIWINTLLSFDSLIFCPGFPDLAVVSGVSMVHIRMANVTWDILASLGGDFADNDESYKGYSVGFLQTWVSTYR